MQRQFSLDEELQQIDEFFRLIPEPANLSAVREKVATFCDAHNNSIVLVTSGGTAVPVEQNMVRFVDNFSAGTRGAASAEYFLNHNYAVVFLYRFKSLEPFTRHVNTLELLKSLTLNEAENHFEVSPEMNDSLKSVVGNYKKFHSNLLMITYTTLSDYLYYLREIALLFQKLKSKAMLYLAAAVSDFYIPYRDMAEHKIQSDEGPLRLHLHMVPKVLRPLVKFWVPEAYVVSFKLETDEKILIPKARKALQKYGHHIVIANMLQTRKSTVLLVDEKHEEQINVDCNGNLEIESLIVDKLVMKHKAFMS